MKTATEIRRAIKEIEKDCDYFLTGTGETIETNVPVALLQLEKETKLRTLYWVLDKVFISKLKFKTIK